MVKRLLLSVAACLVGIATYAQWTEPTLPTTASELVAGHTYNVRNKDAGWYLTGGTAWYGWNTSTILVENQSEALNYVIEQETDPAGDMAWTFKNSATGLYTFISGMIESVSIGEAYMGLGEMHMDGAQNNCFFDITEQDASAHTYRIKVVSTDDTYGEQTGYWGWIKNDENYYSAVYAFLTPGTENHCCDWEFVDITEYLARVELYNALMLSVERGVDNTSASNVYNNSSSTVGEIIAATEALNEAITEAMLGGATLDAPKDATSFIENNDFSTDDTSGWESTYFGVTNFYNMYNQGESTYVNHNGEQVYPNCDHFVEYWTSDNYGPNSTVDISLNDAYLQQTITSMPTGIYKLTVDAVSAQQFETVGAITGMQLFASTSDKEHVLNFTAPTESPLHYELIFGIEKGDFTIGLRTESTNGNWLAADNFELIYYGANGLTDADAVCLTATIMNCEAQYPDPDNVLANVNTKAAYISALEAAKAATSNYATYDDALEAAAEALATSIQLYAQVPGYIQNVENIMEELMMEGLDDAANEIADYLDNVQSKYSDGLLTNEEIDGLSKAGDGIAAQLLLGDATMENPVDATSFIVNNDFSADNTSGWESTYFGTLNWYNMYNEGESTYVNHNNEEVYPNCDLFVEYWTPDNVGPNSTVNISLNDAYLRQTLNSMPAGLYKLTADIVSIQQFETVSSMTGIQFFASAGGIDNVVDITTQTGSPVHYEMIFGMERGDLTLGLRIENTNANWVAADNFELTYYGNNGQSDLEAFTLMSIIMSCESQFPDVESLKANAGIKAAYTSALEAAKSASSDYDSFGTALKAAAAELAASVEEYEVVPSYIQSIAARLESIKGKMEGLENQMSAYLDNLESGFDDCSLTSEDIAALETAVDDMITDYIKNNCQAGDDVSVLLTNNTFDTDIFGWDVEEGGVTPSWGGMDVDEFENEYGSGPKLTEIQSGVVEVWHCAFGLSQTITNMPAGMYTLTCQGYERDDNTFDTGAYQNGEELEAELYVVVDGIKSSQKLMSIYDDPSTVELYNCTGTSRDDPDNDAAWRNDALVTVNGESVYVPYGTNGSNVYFYLGKYVNTMSIPLLEDGNVTIGVRTDATHASVMWDNFRIIYEGNDLSLYISTIKELIDEANAIMSSDDTLSQEVIDKLTTAIAEGNAAMESDSLEECMTAISDLREAIASAQATFVEGIWGADNVTATAIYDLNGRQMSQLTKGVNIVKTTMADGTVKVSKVLVK